MGRTSRASPENLDSEVVGSEEFSRITTLDDRETEALVLAIVACTFDAGPPVERKTLSVPHECLRLEALSNGAFCRYREASASSGMAARFDAQQEISRLHECVQEWALSLEQDFVILTMVRRFIPLNRRKEREGRRYCQLIAAQQTI